MPQPRRHRKRRASEAHDLPPSTVATAPETKDAPVTAARVLPLPDWKWKTFPVYFAFALGGFIGMYTGVIAGVNSGYFSIIAVVWAILLGVGFSRFSTRWIMSRQWAKRQTAKRKK